MAHLERGDGAALGTARGALLLKELPPTRPPDRAASASSGTAADKSSDAANAALASLATCEGSNSCLFWPQTVTALFGKHSAGFLPFRRKFPRRGRWSVPEAIAQAFSNGSCKGIRLMRLAISLGNVGLVCVFVQWRMVGAILSEVNRPRGH